MRPKRASGCEGPWVQTNTVKEYSMFVGKAPRRVSVGFFFWGGGSGTYRGKEIIVKISCAILFV